MLYLSQIFPHWDSSFSFSILIKTYNYFCLVEIENNGYFLEFISAVYPLPNIIGFHWNSFPGPNFADGHSWTKSIRQGLIRTIWNQGRGRSRWTKSDSLVHCSTRKPSIGIQFLKICIGIKSYFRRSKFIYSYSNNTQGPELSWRRQHLLTLYA